MRSRDAGWGRGCRKGTGFAVFHFSFLCLLGWMAGEGPALTPFLAVSPCPDAPRNLTVSVFGGSPTGKPGCSLPPGLKAQPWKVAEMAGTQLTLTHCFNLLFILCRDDLSNRCATQNKKQDSHSLPLEPPKCPFAVYALVTILCTLFYFSFGSSIIEE